MSRSKRTLIVAAVAAGLCGGIGFVQAGAPAQAPVVHLARFEHMHHALEKLREARHEMDIASDIFRGHKAEALDHVDQAIHAAEEGLREQHDLSAAPARLPGAAPLEKYEHIHRALDLLHEARSELDGAEHIFGGHRDKAMEHTDRAIHQLEDAIRDAER